VCETGGARRSWLRGLVDVSKRYLMQVAAHNLGLVMRKLFGVGTPRALQGRAAALARLLAACQALCSMVQACVCLGRSARNATTSSVSSQRYDCVKGR